jgi:hypothetical protein
MKRFLVLRLAIVKVLFGKRVLEVLLVGSGSV